MAHNNYRPLVAAIVATLAATYMMTSCNGFHSSGDGLDYEWCTVEYTDSDSVGQAIAYQEMYVDFPANQNPEDADPATVAALKWLRERVMDCSFPHFEGHGLDSALNFNIDQVERYAEAFLHSCGQQGLDSMTVLLRDIQDEGFSGSYMNFLRIELTEQTTDYLTLCLEHDIYTGGAHGSQYTDGVSFNRQDGGRLGWNMLDMSKKEQLAALLKQGLKEYFSLQAGTPISTDEELEDMLILFDNPETPEDELAYGIPLPVTEPWLTRNGMLFQYQEYEISAYALGKPSVLIPLTRLQDVLSEKGKSYLKN